MDATKTRTVVLKVPVELMNRLSVYAFSTNDQKFLMMTGIQDYLAKREARTRRAERQKAGLK